MGFGGKRFLTRPRAIDLVLLRRALLLPPGGKLLATTRITPVAPRWAEDSKGFWEAGHALAPAGCDIIFLQGRRCLLCLCVRLCVRVCDCVTFFPKQCLH